jgi:hypothetical protein
MLRPLPMSNHDKDVEILALRRRGEPVTAVNVGVHRDDVLLVAQSGLGGAVHEVPVVLRRARTSRTDVSAAWFTLAEYEAQVVGVPVVVCARGAAEIQL